MEEKERYRYFEETNQLYDSQEDKLYSYNLNNTKIISILNQQDKRIKELENYINNVEIVDCKRKLYKGELYMEVHWGLKN